MSKVKIILSDGLIIPLTAKNEADVKEFLTDFCFPDEEVILKCNKYSEKLKLNDIFDL